MDSKNVKSPRTMGSFSRRGFLKGAAVVTAAARSTPLRAASAQVVAYVGAYTDRDGNALYIYDLNTADGTLTRRTAIKDYPSPSSLAVSPNQTLQRLGRTLIQHYKASAGLPLLGSASLSPTRIRIPL